jgi:pimeloyl-ACP methyl ester carboxylesterase
MGRDDKPNVVFLHGGILPVSIQYAPLLKVLNSNIRPLLKELEIYHSGMPIKTYSLSTEVEALYRAVNKAKMDEFHLVSYSAGGTVALAFTSIYPDRVKSLALIEPVVIPNQEWFVDEADYWQQLKHAMSLPALQRVQEFMRVELRQGVPLPVQDFDESQPWMASCAVCLKAMVDTFRDFNLPYDQLKDFPCPVYLAVTEMSNPVEVRKAALLKKLFPVSRVEFYPYRNHFDPPHRAEPEHFAWALISLWERAKSLHAEIINASGQPSVRTGNHLRPSECG